MSTDAAATWIKKELTQLWADLEIAEQASLAPEGKLSMKMENIIDRIREATEIIGPVNWGDVGVLTIHSGRYRRYCELVGLPYTYPTEEEFETMILPYVHEEDRVEAIGKEIAGWSANLNARLADESPKADS